MPYRHFRYIIFFTLFCCSSCTQKLQSISRSNILFDTYAHIIETLEEGEDKDNAVLYRDFDIKSLFYREYPICNQLIEDQFILEDFIALDNNCVEFPNKEITGYHVIELIELSSEKQDIALFLSYKVDPLQRECAPDSIHSKGLIKCLFGGIQSPENSVQHQAKNCVSWFCFTREMYFREDQGIVRSKDIDLLFEFKHRNGDDSIENIYLHQIIDRSFNRIGGKSNFVFDVEKLVGIDKDSLSLISLKSDKSRLELCKR